MKKFTIKNRVFREALKYSGFQFGEITPEIVIYSYAKLLTMDENRITEIFSEKEKMDIYEVFRWLGENSINVRLVKSCMPMLFSYMPDFGPEKTSVLMRLLMNIPEGQSERILDIALKNVRIPLTELFRTDKGKQDIIAYQRELIKERHSEEDETEETQPAETEEFEPSEPDSAEPETEGADEGNPFDEVTPDEEELPFPDEDFEEPEDSEEEPEESPDEYGDEDQYSDEPFIDEDLSLPTDDYEWDDMDDSFFDLFEREDTLEKLSKKYQELASYLLTKIKGQDSAVINFLQGYNQGEMLKNTDRGNYPRNTFFFFGPPGVGKTYLAEEFMAFQTRAKIPCKRFDMSEYTSREASDALIGTGKRYSNTMDGALTSFVSENPECVLFFDEIEKADIKVLRIFLQILGSGFVTSASTEKEVSFRDATLIFTSNLGKSLYMDKSQNLTAIPHKVLIDAIRDEKDSNDKPILPPELCSRFEAGNIIVFNHLSARHLCEIVEESLESFTKGMREEYKVDVSYHEHLPLLFMMNKGVDLDARVAKSKSRSFLKDEMYELLRQIQKNDEIAKNIQSIHFDVDIANAEREVKSLFEDSESEKVLIFTSKDSDLEEALNSGRYIVTVTDSISKAETVLKKGVSAVYIDPLIGANKDDERILSIADYNSKGIKLFRSITDNDDAMPVYILERNGRFSEADRMSFLREGAFGIKTFNDDQILSFIKDMNQTLEDLYIERRNSEFNNSGQIVGYNTKQIVSEEGTHIDVIFYDLKKKTAVDGETRELMLLDADKPGVKFRDVIGAENAKEELLEIVQYFKNPQKYLIDKKPPKGILLYGPPGTGKTMLAQALAGEAGVPFFAKSASEFKEQWTGSSEKNIRKLFAKARAMAPSIIFIDEIDAIGRQRTGESHVASTENMLAQLLTEMRRFEKSDPKKMVFVIAATNFSAGNGTEGIGSLDPALVRRLDTPIYVDLPNEAERKLFLERELKKYKNNKVSEEAISNLAERTTGINLDILGSIVSKANTKASNEKRPMTGDDLTTAYEEHNFGEEKKHSKEYYWEVAIHEAGHAYVNYLCGERPSFVTIESRGNFGGYMEHGNQENVESRTRNDMISLIRTSLAGRASEKEFFGEDKALNTGASSDLEHATNVAFAILTKYGMQEGMMAVFKREDILKSSLAADYVLKVNELLLAEMKETEAIVRKGRGKIEEIANALIKENRISGKKLSEIIEN